MSKYWTQLYVMLVEYKKTSVLMAFGIRESWMVGKVFFLLKFTFWTQLTFIRNLRFSYHVFILLLMLEYHHRFGVEKICLKSLAAISSLGNFEKKHFQSLRLSMIKVKLTTVESRRLGWQVSTLRPGTNICQLFLVTCYSPISSPCGDYWCSWRGLTLI